MKRITVLTVLLGLVVFSMPTQSQPPGRRPSRVVVVNEPTVRVGDVEINNTELNPVPVLNMNGVMQPFQQKLFFYIEEGSTQEQATFDVPRDKQLVIEHVSARVQGPSGTEYIGGITTAVYGEYGGGGKNWLVFTKQMSRPGLDVFTASQPMRVYTEYALPTRAFVVTRSTSTGESFAEATISGYIVDRLY